MCKKSQPAEVKNAILNLNLFPLSTRHALLVVALKPNTDYDAKVMKDACGAYIKVILFSRSVAHAEVILENGDLQTNARNFKNYLVYLDSENCILFYMNVAVESYK